jgi:hypothetical protein
MIAGGEGDVAEAAAEVVDLLLHHRRDRVVADPGQSEQPGPECPATSGVQLVDPACTLQRRQDVVTGRTVEPELVHKDGREPRPPVPMGPGGPTACRR